MDDRTYYYMVGTELFTLRRRKGWDRRMLAEKVGVSIHSIASIETGRQGLTLRRAHRVARALGVRVEDITRIAEEEVVKTEGNSSEQVVDAEEEALWKRVAAEAKAREAVEMGQTERFDVKTVGDDRDFQLNEAPDDEEDES